MQVEFTDFFLKSLKKIKDQSVKIKIKQFIIELEKADTLQEISNVKKIQGYTYFYRWRTGNYRLGFQYKNNIATLLIFAHRGRIYKKFP